MTRDELIKDFRVTVMDQVEDYLFETATLARWLAEAEEQAAIRGRLLHESSDPSVCEIHVEPGVAVYPLHSALYEIDSIGLRVEGDTARRPLRLTSTGDLDRTRPGWRDETGRVVAAVQGDTTIRLVPTPDTGGTLLLEGYRLPLRSLATSTSGMPEIHRAHHPHLVDWALYRALSLPDAETLDLGKAQDAEQRFTAYFGPLPDSDLRRITREDGPHHNVAWP